jgi:hypothetical protein
MAEKTNTPSTPMEDIKKMSTPSAPMEDIKKESKKVVKDPLQEVLTDLNKKMSLGISKSFTRSRIIH